MIERSRTQRARLAVLAAFFINGFLLATWVSRIPAVQIKLGMSEGTLGLVLMGISAGGQKAREAPGDLRHRGLALLPAGQGGAD